MATQIDSGKRAVKIFTILWLVGTSVASVYFSFWLFPEIYEKRTSAVVEVHFQTTMKASDGSSGLVYYPNQPTFKASHGEALSDSNFLYFSACEALPLSQRPICDTQRNWKKLDPKKVGCGTVSACNVDTYRMGEDERYVMLANVNPLRGANFSIGDLQSPSLSDPGGWGNAAKLPLFFVCMFLGIKLGRSIGEFVFTPYEK